MQEYDKKQGTHLKYISLITLTAQNAAVALSTRYSRTRGGDMYMTSTAVLNAELVKLVICLFATLLENDTAPRKWLRCLWDTVVLNPVDTFKVCIPSMLYVIQNNFMYVAACHLDAATYQVTFQLRILTTAVFSMILLRRRLSPTQWAALLLLLVGVALVQISQMVNVDVEVDNMQNSTSSGAWVQKQNKMLGFMAVFTAAWISGFAGIYFERILKGADISVWMRNVQLSLCSVPFGVLTCAWKDLEGIRENGYFYGYDAYVVYIVILHAAGGLAVAMVLKYSDNILKCFASAFAIVIACIVSALFFDLQITLEYFLGTIFVILSTFLYSHKPRQQDIGKDGGVVMVKDLTSSNNNGIVKA